MVNNPSHYYLALFDYACVIRARSFAALGMTCAFFVIQIVR
jgi:hypothetical protein